MRYAAKGKFQFGGTLSVFGQQKKIAFLEGKV
jgi:hypothetical protein